MLFLSGAPRAAHSALVAQGALQRDDRQRHRRARRVRLHRPALGPRGTGPGGRAVPGVVRPARGRAGRRRLAQPQIRSEEHTSELQSLMRISYAVFCLKKKNIQNSNNESTNKTLTI